MTCYKAQGVSRKDIRRFVKKIKKLVGLENELYFPIVEFLENILPEIIPDFQLEILPRLVMGDKHGETFPNRNIIRIREDVYDRAVEGGERDRMTIAHEIGHLFMHEEENISLCRMNSKQRLPAYEDPEWQADAFGGELLASSYLIEGMSPCDVRDKCGVTISAARVQLNALHK
ncbi:ImmA/IrrE family metallo-endopeptidase [Falcatimonas sp. MSJ-15]|uniref:ImmA/IrrE family metallo-endopeptidase n=1 Tax=Falcatimonas sp. MSJ-15 TaxID=2841515 RepID=UPI001C0F5CAD|nr:ImmA/IrrE family metallo-endopeptidase [Falcatimonas sp. MSJ-15]MBU5469811.1 ImmA/IrrE family metallo-endopeptidase [Falcatimonas sp. MSJ-15]